MVTCSNPSVCENWHFFRCVMAQVESILQYLSRKATLYIVLLASEGVPAAELPRSVGASSVPTYWNIEEKSRTETATSF